MSYLHIQDYGVIGNMRTVALVGTNGSIDWFCFPKFDSPSVFGALLDEKKGGYFKIAPKQMKDVTTKQHYWPGTNVLVTRFLCPEGVADVVDFMPVGTHLGAKQYNQLIRLVKGVRGSLPMSLECVPAFNYARDDHHIEMDERGAHISSNLTALHLSADAPLYKSGTGIGAEFILEEGQSFTFALQQLEPEKDGIHKFFEEEAQELFKETLVYWRQWLSQCTYKGRWREMVERSALTLKLLTYEPTGAIVAAPTCSLPETIGGVRNWDYRYTWIRDAAFTVYALIRIGFTDAAREFIKWIENCAEELNPDGSLQVVYSIDGRHELDEQILDHLDGYRGSRPVRIGNGAYNQLQLDIYGELMDAVYLYNKYGTPISYHFWTHLRQMANWVVNNWRRADDGIWEFRGGKQHFVYSKVMCWVALDRALRLADKRSFPADRETWQKERDCIYEEIMNCGWSEERQAFIQAYDSTVLDASTLIMPLVFFQSPTDPRMLKTIDAINRAPEAGGLMSNSLVYRYNVEDSTDGVCGREGAFNICTFWLVEALTRAGRDDPLRLEEARLIFENMLGYANHLGLYSEQTGPSGEALGNFPQAFTHLALISAAFNLDRALG